MLSFEEFTFSMEEDGTKGGGEEDLTKMSDEDLRKYIDHHTDAVLKEQDATKIQEHLAHINAAGQEGHRRFENLSKEEKIKRLHQMLNTRTGDLHPFDAGSLVYHKGMNSEEYQKAVEAFERGKKFRAAGKWGAIGSGVVGAGYLGYKALSHHKDEPSHEDYLSWENYVRGEYNF